MLYIFFLFLFLFLILILLPSLFHFYFFSGAVYGSVGGMGGVPLPSTFPWAAMGVGVRGKPRRGMLRRAVFSDFQRKGLEDRFQVQKYISKPDRKKLAEKLGLKDSQVSGGEVC